MTVIKVKGETGMQNPRVGGKNTEKGEMSMISNIFIVAQSSKYQKISWNCAIVLVKVALDHLGNHLAIEVNGKKFKIQNILSACKKSEKHGVSMSSMLVFIMGWTRINFVLIRQAGNIRANTWVRFRVESSM